jgi:hypothetical protein
MNPNRAESRPMTYTVYTQANCPKCKEIVWRLTAATGDIPEVLDEDSLAAMPDKDRRNNLMAQIHERVRTDFPFVFRDDDMIEVETLEAEGVI